MSATDKPFRVIATGLRGGRANIAFDQALIEARREEKIPDTIRFLRFRPSALIGIHQYLSHELKLDYCKAHGIETVRRITGGGGLYFDEGQIGWELVFDRATLGVLDLAEVTRRICEAAALGLRKLGVPAHYRPRNDIEVDGRKISGTGGFFDGNLIFYQGTLLIDFDPAKMLACLNVPAEKLAKRAIDWPRNASSRCVKCWAALYPISTPFIRDSSPDLPKASALRRHGVEITDYEEELAERVFREEIGTDGYVTMLDAPPADDALVSASLTGRGGSVRADIRLEGLHRDRIREALITGDFFITPPRVVFDLEASLRGLNVADAGEAVESFFRRTPTDFLSLGAGDFRQVIEMALSRRAITAEAI